MATREENLKKINEQLEKMSDEQLEQVAGGSLYNSAIVENKLNQRPDSATVDMETGRL